MVAIIVIPNFLRDFKILINSKAMLESRPVVGSSKNNKLGFCINSTPTLTLFLSPPDKPLIFTSPTLVSWHFYNLKRLIISSTFSLILNS